MNRPGVVGPVTEKRIYIPGEKRVASRRPSGFNPDRRVAMPHSAK